MRFSFKVFCCTILVIAVALSFSGAYLMSAAFSSAIQREKRQALDENNVLRFTLETVAANAPLKYGRLQDNTIAEISGMLRTVRTIRLSGEDGRPVYSSAEFHVPQSLLGEITGETQACRVVSLEDGRHMVYTAVGITLMDRQLYMETVKDISSVFSDRQQSLVLYRRVALATLLGGALIMLLISIWLTRPVRMLSGAAISMAGGNYGVRARQVSGDEIGRLAADFNTMATALESQISALREAAESRERFIAAFAHELKTPLTSIVGYADALRAYEPDEALRLMAANYIYDAGMQLETLSFRLLDLVVLKNTRLKAADTPVERLADFVRSTFSGGKGVTLSADCEEAEVFVEASLITTVLINLVENAVKASGEGGRVELTGRIAQGGYRFAVKDYGCGIPADEIDKLEQAFYMVDKSRSRSRHGVGLGLTLCSEILALHESALEISSAPGEGALVSFLIPAKGGVAHEG